MTDHYKAIYRDDAERYDVLVRAEDYQGNLLPAIQHICNLDDTLVVELGTGTGRLTRLLAQYARQIISFDISPTMLWVAESNLSGLYQNLQLGVADNRNPPIKTRFADLVIVGWSIGHFVGWYPETWRDEVRQVLGEMLRVVKNEGKLIIIETMGTGNAIPTPPHQGLADYYHMLETDWDFKYSWIRTDYRFQSQSEADTLLKFFFKTQFTYLPNADGTFTLPECTGIWWR